MDQKRLREEATALLRKNGYTAGGRVRKDVDPEQYTFERRICIPIPTGGQPKRGGIIVR